MSKSPKPNSKRAIDKEGRAQEPNTFLETQKKHQDWYEPYNMGKQRGKPHANAPTAKKPKGIRKHQLRKEK